MAVDPNVLAAALAADPDFLTKQQARQTRQAIADGCADIAPDNIVTNSNVNGAINMARTYLNTANASITDTMTKNMMKVLIQIVFFMVRKILLPGYN